MRLSAAVLALAAATALFFSGVLASGISRVVPQTTYDPMGTPRAHDWQTFETADTTLATWLVSRNARTLVRSPSQLFETEHCAPASNALAFGEPMITLGAIAIPSWLATGEASATYNMALLTLFFVTALVMLLLVGDWTGSLTAGVAAALLYAFSGERASDITHPFVYDTAWTVLAMYFARRLLVKGRWRDAAGLAACGTLQLGTSLYPTLGALLLTLPIAAWLIVTYPPRGRHILKLGMVGIVVISAAYAIFSPYLEARAANDSLARDLQHYAAWSWFLPGREGGITFSAFTLAVIALLFPSLRATRPISRSVVVPLVVGTLLAGAASVGPASVPNVYELLTKLLPGLDAVRVPARVDAGFHAGLCILAGVGIAALESRSGRYSRVVGAAAIAIAFAETLATTPTGLSPFERFATIAIGPEAEDIAFFDTLSEMGDSGPLLELPLGNDKEEYIFKAPPRILLTLVHGRRTSACYGSFFPPRRETLRLAALTLPSPAAIGEIRALGFQTVVVHTGTPLGDAIADQLRAVSYTPESGIGYLASGKNMIAFRLAAE